jgi:hypothetical protein
VVVGPSCWRSAGCTSAPTDDCCRFGSVKAPVSHGETGAFDVRTAQTGAARLRWQTGATRLR